MSLVLALCMVISLLPMTAFAASGDKHTLTVNLTGVTVSENTVYGTASVKKGDADQSPTEITTASGTVEVTEGTDSEKLIISIVAPTGYAVDTVKKDTDQPLDANEDGDYVLENITADVSITVTYKQVFDITVTSPTGGTATATQATAAAGEQVTVNVKANDGFQIDKVQYTPDGDSAADATAGTVDADGNTPYTFTMPNKAVTVTATFTEVDYKVAIDSNITGGTVAADVSTANKDDTVTLTVTPATGNEIKAVTVTPKSGTAITPTKGDTQDGATTYTFAMPASDVTVGATFGKVTYAIAGTGSLTNGSVTATVGGETVTSANEGDVVTLVVTPAEGYQLKDGTLKVTKTTGGETVSLVDNKFTMPAEGVTVAAEFEAIDYTITVNETKGDVSSDTSITVNVDSSNDTTYDPDTKPTANIGQNVTVKVTAPKGYIARVSGVAGGTETTPTDPIKSDAAEGTNETSYSFTMPADDANIAVTYEVVKAHKITITPPQNGSVTSSIVTADANDEVTLTITPATGYELDTLTVTDADAAAVPVTDNKFTMPDKNVTVSATFKQSTYTITVTEPTNGTVTVTDEKTEAHYQDSISLTVTPDNEYEISAVTMTPAGGSATTLTATGGPDAETGATTYSFTMPAADVTITATFVKEGSENPTPPSGGSSGGSTTPTRRTRPQSPLHW